MNIICAGQTDKGKVRPHNEDNYGTPEMLGIDARLRDELGCLLVVADGMGGRAAGEVASKIAVETIFRRFYSDAQGDRRSALSLAIAAANATVYDASKASEDRDGMGCTFAILLTKGDHALAANVGDSRVYRIRDQRAEQLTEDHTWVAESIRAGVITPDEAATHPYRHVISRAVGVEPVVSADISLWFPLSAGDRFLLCSDGLSNEVNDAGIGQIAADGPVARAARQLIAAANRAGGHDNVTALLAAAGDSSAAATSGVHGAVAAGVLVSVLALAAGLLLWQPWARDAGWAPPPVTVTATVLAITVPADTPTAPPTSTFVPTTTPEPTATATSSPAPTAASTSTSTITPTSTPTVTSTWTSSATPTASATSSATPAPSATITAFATGTPSLTATLTASVQASSTDTPTATSEARALLEAFDVRKCATPYWEVNLPKAVAGMCSFADLCPPPLARVLVTLDQGSSVTAPPSLTQRNAADERLLPVVWRHREPRGRWAPVSFTLTTIRPQGVESSEIWWWFDLESSKQNASAWQIRIEAVRVGETQAGTLELYRDPGLSDLQFWMTRNCVYRS